MICERSTPCRHTLTVTFVHSSLKKLTEEIKRYDTEEIQRQKAEEGVACAGAELAVHAIANQGAQLVAHVLTRHAEEIRDRLRNSLGSTVGNLVEIVMERQEESRASHAEEEAASVEPEPASEELTAATAAVSDGADEHASVSNEEKFSLLKYQKLPPLRFVAVETT